MNLVLASSIIGLPVASLKEEAKLGVVKKILIDIDSGAIYGYLVQKSLFAKPEFIDAKDILGAEKAAFVVDSASALNPIDEIVRAKKMLETGFKLFGLPVLSSNQDKKIGKVDDFAISVTNSLIMSLYVRNFLGDRIIPRQKIVKITKKNIIVDDDASLMRSLPVAEKI